MDRSIKVATLQVLLAVIFWGASFIATKIAIQDVSPVTVVWLRFAMGLVILGFAVLSRNQFVLPVGKELGYLALLGFLGITFHQWLQSTGLVTSRASTTAWIVASTPIFMGLFGWLLLRERLFGIQVFGILFAACGVILVVSGGDLSSISLRQFGAPGDVLILLSAPNWALFSILSRRGLLKYPAASMMFYVMGFGWMFTSVLFFTGPGLSEIPRLSFAGWASVAFLGIFCSGFAYIFWYGALQTLTSSQAGAFLYLEPLVAVLVAGILLHEPLSWASVIGGAAILVGVWLVNRMRGQGT